MINYTNRDEIPAKYKWSIDEMYPSDKKWDDDLKTALELTDKLAGYKGTLGSSSKRLSEFLSLRDEMWQILERAFVFARMSMDEDNRDGKRQGRLSKVHSVISKVSASLAFFTPELLNEDVQKLLGFIDENPDLNQYRFLLNEIIRQKPHTLSEAEETIIAKLGEVTDSGHEIFNMLNNADMDFGTIKDEANNDIPLTHGNYISFLENKNGDVRKRAYEKMYNTYKSFNNTLTATYASKVKSAVIHSKIAGFESSRAASLFSGNIPERVYDNLIEIVNNSLPTLHEYMAIRKKILGVEKLHMWDIYTPLFEPPHDDIPFDEALNMVIDGLSPLGEVYLRDLKKGMNDRWMDVYETPGKTSGAYSFGSYDSKPYVLLNYTNSLKDVFTIAHELGHSMHSYYTRKNQPFTYGDHSIFTAEVASTVNESLLIRDLINKADDKDIKKYLIGFYIEEFRTTLFRQTMFAEFEMLSHRTVENDQPLTSTWLNETYNELNFKYQGSDMQKDDLIQYEWSRIPHFYRPFYVYQYATGFSAATAISASLIDGSPDALQGYLKFLSSGSSNHPVELLKYTGLDMASPEPIKNAMNVFKELVDELKKLI